MTRCKCFKKINQELFDNAFTENEINITQYHLNNEMILVNKVSDSFIPFVASVNTNKPIDVENDIVYEITVFNKLFGIWDGKCSYYLIIINNFFNSKIMFCTNNFGLVENSDIPNVELWKRDNNLNYVHIRDGQWGILMKFDNGINDNVANVQASLSCRCYITLDKYSMYVTINQLWKLLAYVNNKKLKDLRSLLWILHKKIVDVTLEEKELLTSYVGDVKYLFQPLYITNNNIKFYYKYVGRISRTHIGNYYTEEQKYRMADFCHIFVDTQLDGVYDEFCINNIKHRLKDNFYHSLLRSYYVMKHGNTDVCFLQNQDTMIEPDVVIVYDVNYGEIILKFSELDNILNNQLQIPCISEEVNVAVKQVINKITLRSRLDNSSIKNAVIALSEVREM